MKKSIILFVVLFVVQSVVVNAARLPTVGGDADDWGTILNEFLSVSLDSDGTLKETQNGNLTINGTTSVNELCIVGDCRTAWPAGVTNGTGEYSTVLGYNNTASGNYSLAVGLGSKASNIYAIAMGYYTNASGIAAVALGDTAVASGSPSIAMGASAVASGFASMASGYISTASGEYSTAMGGNTRANGSYSTAMGGNTIADSYASLVLGRYNVGGGDPLNWVDTDPIFEIGIGTADDNRSNALTVLKNGNVGIGVSDPSLEFEVQTRTPNDGDILAVRDSDGDAVFVVGETGTGDGGLSLINSSGDPNVWLLSNGDSYLKGGNVGIGTPSPARSLHINDTMRIEPRSDAPSSPSLGDLYVDSDLNELCFYNSTDWIGLVGGGVCS